MFGFGKSSIWEQDWPYFAITGVVLAIALAAKKDPASENTDNNITVDLKTDETSNIEGKVEIKDTDSDVITYAEVMDHIYSWFEDKGKSGFSLVRYDKLGDNTQITIKYYDRLGNTCENNNTVLNGEMDDSLNKAFDFFNTFLVRDEKNKGV